jgi:hypothetical protein
MAQSVGLYADTLFHFTSKDGLFGILRKKHFTASYARERIVSGGAIKEFGVPMVSFCDLRLSELKSHINKYGRYGIGLAKKWAHKNGLNPVFYVSADWPSANAFITAVETLYAHLGKIEDGDEFSEITKAYMDIFNFYRYIKNYHGDLRRSGHRIKRNYRFADEREWRYVPPITDHLYAFMAIDNIRTADQKAKMNAKLENVKLLFEPKDIKYLVVRNDRERSEVIDQIEKEKSGLRKRTRQKLASRILTAEQIARDM